ncbi:MAG: hypothetical protein LBG88_04215 [Christensenellaceae bacterium]|jgi:hypothetical protein|nr:hypothetical protein [Christensenellaceae bacterium]
MWYFENKNQIIEDVTLVPEVVTIRPPVELVQQTPTVRAMVTPVADESLERAIELALMDVDKSATAN